MRARGDPPPLHPAQVDLSEIIDVFSGADGGVAFACLKVVVDRLSAQAQAGDSQAAEVLAIVTRFRKLISVAGRLP